MIWLFIFLLFLLFNSASAQKASAPNLIYKDGITYDAADTRFKYDPRIEKLQSVDWPNNQSIANITPPSSTETDA